MLSYEEQDDLYGFCECVNGLDHCPQHRMEEHRVRPDVVCYVDGRKLCYWCKKNCNA